MLSPSLNPVVRIKGADQARIGAYETRWWRWVCAGLPGTQVLVEQKAFTGATGRLSPA